MDDDISLALKNKILSYFCLNHPQVVANGYTGKNLGKYALQKRRAIRRVRNKELILNHGALRKRSLLYKNIF
jgi:hypothetical protein